jgi:predicted permease
MISTSSFILLFSCIFWTVAFLLSLATMGYMIHERAFETTPLQRFGYVILALILTPILWVIGVALIFDYIFRKIIKSESENKVS